MRSSFRVTALSAIGTVWIVFNKLVLGIPIQGYAFLVTGVLFLGGVQILMLGMIGENTWGVSTLRPSDGRCTS